MRLSVASAKVIIFLLIIVSLTACGGGGGGGGDSSSSRTAEQTAATLSTNLEGQVNASMAVLRALDNGLSLLQIVNAVDTNNLEPDGTISSPTQRSLAALQRNISGYSTTSIAAELGESADGGLNVLTAIFRAIGRGYDLGQIIESIFANTLTQKGTINCLSPDLAAGLCTSDGKRVEPKNAEQSVFSDIDGVSSSSDSGSGVPSGSGLWPVGTWNTSGICPASDGVTGGTLGGTTTLNGDGSLNYNWTLTFDSGSTTVNSGSGSWSYSGGALAIFVPTEYSGSVNQYSSSASLSSHLCWQLTLTQ